MPSTETEPIWRYASAATYSAPAVKATESVRDRVVSVWRGMLASRKARNGATKLVLEPPDDEATHGLSFDPLVVQPSLDELVAATRSVRSGAGPNTLVIGPPGAGVSDALRCWAERHDAQILEPPTHDALLDGEVVRVPDGDESSVYVLPALERCTMRHPAGLAALREFTESVRTHAARVVIGCDSFTWHYLDRAIQISSALPHAAALQPLEGEHLLAWLGDMYGANGRSVSDLCFARSGTPVLADCTERGRDALERQESFFETLAWKSRGIPGLALALFTNALRTEHESIEKNADVPAHRAVPRVLEPGDWDLPAVPAGLDKLDTIVLHALLMHSGLPEGVIHRLLPFDSARITRSLFALRTSSLAREDDGHWVVPRLAYPSVRGYLAREGFLVDTF